MGEQKDYVRWFEDLHAGDVAQVGGKNASLGEMISALREEGILVPGGFATTAHAYRTFLDHNDLEGEIRALRSASCSWTAPSPRRWRRRSGRRTAGAPPVTTSYVLPVRLNPSNRCCI